MYKVRATIRKEELVHACGTAEQALGKALELIAKGATNVRVVDPALRVWSAEEFRRKFYASFQQ